MLRAVLKGQVLLVMLLAVALAGSTPIAADIIVISKSIAKNTEWGKDGSESAYCLNSAVVVEEGATLTVHGGTEVRFVGDGRLVVYGSLRVRGSAEQPVLLRAYNGQPLSKGHLNIGGDADLDGCIIQDMPESGSTRLPFVIATRPDGIQSRTFAKSVKLSHCTVLGEQLSLLVYGNKDRDAILEISDCNLLVDELIYDPGSSTAAGKRLDLDVKRCWWGSSDLEQVRARLLRGGSPTALDKDDPGIGGILVKSPRTERDPKSPDASDLLKRASQLSNARKDWKAASSSPASAEAVAEAETAFASALTGELARRWPDVLAYFELAVACKGKDPARARENLIRFKMEMPNPKGRMVQEADDLLDSLPEDR